MIAVRRQFPRRQLLHQSPVRTFVFLALLVAGILGSSAGPAWGAEEFDKYELESASVSLSSAQAGAHADVTVAFALSQKEGKPYAQTRDVKVGLPQGVIGNPQGIPRCTVAQLGNVPEESECPFDSQVGVSQVTTGGLVAGTFAEPVYNMEPPGGDVVARFGFFAGPYPAFLNIRVDPIDYSLTATVEGAPSASGLIAATTTLWGVPAASSHDLDRRTPEEALKGESPPGGGPPACPKRRSSPTPPTAASPGS